MTAAGAAGAPHELLKACFSLLTVARAIDADCAARLGQYQLTEGKFVLLFFLAQHPSGLAPSQLAKLAGVTKATVTGLSEGLVKLGHVKRQPARGDRRSFTLVLTTAGQKLTERLLQEHGAWIGSLFKGLDSGELARFEALLAVIWQQTDEGKLSPVMVPGVDPKQGKIKHAKNARKKPR